MKKIIKYSLSVLALVVVLLLLVPFFLNVEDYKQEIEQQVEDATGRVLKIGGLQASLFPWVGVTLDDVVLANRQGFSERDFLKVKHLNVQVALLPLLSQRLEIVRFKLEAPEIFMERNAKGEGNWEDLLPASPESMTAVAGEPENSVPAAKDDEKTGSALAALSAESLQLLDGKFIWQDAQSGVRIALTDVQVELDDVQLEHPVGVKISARLNGDKIDIDAQLGPVGDLASLDVNKLPIQLSLKSDAIRLKSFATLIGSFPEKLGDINKASVMLNMQLEQRPDGVRLLAGEGALLAAMNIALDWKVEMPNVNTLRLNHVGIAINDKPLFAIQGDVKKLNKAPRYTLRIQGENIQRTWLASLLPELNQMYAAHPSPWKTLKIGASLAGTKDRVDLRDMQVLLDGEIVQLSGSVGFAKAPNIRLRLAAKTLHLDPWLPQPAEASANSSENASGNTLPAKNSDTAQANKAAVEPDLRFLKPWRVSMQMQVEKLFMRGLELGHLRGTLKGERGVFTLSPLGFDLAGGQVRETASLNVNRYPVTWTESIHISGLKLKPILEAVAGTDLLDGTMRLDTNLKATGLLPKTSMASLNGTGQLLLQNGRIKGFDIAGGLRNLSTLGSQKSASAQYTDFAQLQASFKIRNGIAKNDDLFMASPLFRLTGKGVVNLPAATLDFHVRPKLIGSLVGQGDTLTVRKGLSVPLHIYGPFASPSIKPELDAKSLLENAGGLMGSGAGGVGGILGGLLGGKNAQPAKSQPAEIKPKSQPLTPEQQIQKGLKGILGF
ncbi:MAG: AsmA family protein [Proteobacteria bacterium]|nr:MAG: AsmA family protein [Pseudomonadota bacterium]